MQEISRASQLADSLELRLKSSIEALAPVYDRFARAWEPQSAEADKAEKEFYAELNRLYGCLSQEEVDQIPFNDFRKFIVSRCRKLVQKQGDKHSSI
jgi:hypothetical protein